MVFVRIKKKMKKTKLRLRGVSDTSVLKDKIQSLLRDIAILRDSGCILRNTRFCGGLPGEAVLQFDHLITRANAATYAVSKLGVCVCRPCHMWKKYHQKQYDALVKELISPERVELWEKCEKDSWMPIRTTAYDWKLYVVVLERELKELQDNI